MQSILVSLTTAGDTLTILKLVIKRNTRHGSGGQLTLTKVHEGRGVTKSGRTAIAHDSNRCIHSINFNTKRNDYIHVVVVVGEKNI